MRTTRSLIIFALFGSALFAAAPLTATNTTHIPQQVFAIHMDTAAEEEQEVIVDQGVIASAKSPQIVPSPNEQIQQATILPYRNDGSIYQGVLTFTATKPVD